MTWELAHNLDMDKYSALVAVGGDGTYHEVVNGMLHRADKRRLPVAFIPNGSGNDTLRSFGVTDITKALDYIIKGDLIKVDVTRLLMDHDTEESIPQDEKPKYLRYQLINSSYGIPAKVNHGASRWKSCCCNAYQISAIIEFTRIKYDLVDVYCDGQLLVENQLTPFLMGFSGKHGGNGMLLNPWGVINDGQMELLYIQSKAGAKTMADFMDKAIKRGGIHGYDSITKAIRGKSIRFVNKNPKTGKESKDT